MNKINGLHLTLEFQTLNYKQTKKKLSFMTPTCDNEVASKVVYKKFINNTR